MNKTYTIHNLHDLKNAFGEIKRQGLGSPHTLTYREGKEKRKEAQSRLYYHWIGEMAEQSGYGRDYWRGVLKWEIGCPLLAAEDADFNRLIYQPFMETYTYEVVLEIMGTDHIQVTSDMSVKQMSKFLEEVKFRANKEGFTLSDLDDIYYKLVHNAE